MRDRFAKRPGGSSIPVGEVVRVLREGELKDMTGPVLLARSGYYQVRLPNDSLVFFRGKELWMVADGEPPPAHELWPPPMPRYGQAAASSSSTDNNHAKAEGENGGYWQAWGGMEGVRKRKPTLLYDAENGGQSEAYVPGGQLFSGFGHSPGRSRMNKDRSENVSLGLVEGAEVLILKSGPYYNQPGMIASMGNGYFQVVTEGGLTLNLRAKECEVVGAGDDSSHRRALPYGTTADAAAYPGTAFRGPTASAAPPAGSRAALSSAAPHKIRTGSHQPSRSGAHRRSTDIVVGQKVTVLRHGAHAGASGKVTAARNGYLIVLLSSGRSAYFRAKDLQSLGRPSASRC